MTFIIKLRMRKGFKLKCKKDINNIVGIKLFEKNKDYEVIYVDHESTKVLVCLNNVIYPLDWVNENFMIKK